LGHIAAFSFVFTKNLKAYGDAARLRPMILLLTASSARCATMPVWKV